MIKHAKELFYSNLENTMVEFNSSNPRLYWKTVRMLLKKNASNGNSIPPLHNPDNSYSFTDLEKADSLNDYFVSISSVDDLNVILPTFNLKTRSELINISVTETEITDVIDNLDSNKASGPDEISHKMLKATSSSVCTPLCILFNRSLT